MKKSTIFLLVIVYVVSIIVVGFFGASIRASNVYTYVESIHLVDPTNEILKPKTIKEGKSYAYTMDYVPDDAGDCSVSIKAIVKPDNADAKKVTCSYDESKSSIYEIVASNVDFNVFIITFHKAGAAVGHFVSTDGMNVKTAFVVQCK